MRGSGLAPLPLSCKFIVQRFTHAVLLGAAGFQTSQLPGLAGSQSAQYPLEAVGVLSGVIDVLVIVEGALACPYGICDHLLCQTHSAALTN